MRCGKAEKLMAAYAAEEPRGEMAPDLKTHLAQCSRCREALAAYEAGLGALKRSRVRQAPPEVMQDFWPEVRRRLPRQAPAHGRSLGDILGHMLPGRTPRIAWALATAAVVALAGWMYFSAAPQRGVPPDRETRGLTSQAQRTAHPPTMAPSGEVPFTPMAKLIPTDQQGRHFFALRPSVRPPRFDSNVSMLRMLRSPALAGTGTTYALPSARLASVDE